MTSHRLHPVTTSSVPLLLCFLSISSFGAEKPSPASHSKPIFHPKIFEMIECWVSDGESPIATEINLDAVAANRNQFDPDGVKRDGPWCQWTNAETHGYLRYRVMESKSGRYTVEFQNNGGGTLTTRAIIVVALGKRTLHVDGKSREIRVLRVESYASK